MKMNRLSQLDHFREMTDRTLFGLKAGDEIKQRIIQNALSASETNSSVRFRRMIPLLISLSVAMIMLFFFAGTIPAWNGSVEPQIISISAGSAHKTSIALKIHQDSYIVVKDPAYHISLLEKIGEVNQIDIVSELFPAGSEVFRTDRNYTVAVVTEDGVTFLEIVPIQ
jgi:hypothetical protein